MTDEEATEVKPPDQVGGSSQPLTGKARSLANLRPPWGPDNHANRSGLAKDGLAAKTAPIRKLLSSRLQKKRAAQRMVDRWVRDAIEDPDGSVRAKAREQILARLDPVVKDQGEGSIPIVHMGIRLELADGHIRDASFALQAGEESQMDHPALAQEAQEDQAEGSEGVPESDRNPS